MVEEERVQRTMEFLKWLGGAAGSLAQNVSVGTPTVSVGLPTCVLIVPFPTVKYRINPTIHQSILLLQDTSFKPGLPHMLPRNYQRAPQTWPLQSKSPSRTHPRPTHPNPMCCTTSASVYHSVLSLFRTATLNS